MIVIISRAERRHPYNIAPDDSVARNSQSLPEYLSRQHTAERVDRGREQGEDVGEEEWWRRRRRVIIS